MTNNQNTKFQAIDYFTITFSLIALLFSFYTFYIQNMEDRHSLRATASLSVSFSTDSAKSLNMFAVVVNTGNKTEIISNAVPKYYNGKEPEQSGIDFPKDPRVLKPGEATTFIFHDSISYTNKEGRDLLYGKPDKDGNLITTFTPLLEFTVVKPNGSSQISKYHFDINKPDSAAKWMELLE